MLPLTVAETLQTTAVIRSLSNLALIFRIITEVCWQHFSTLCFSASTEPFIHFRTQTDKRMSLNISELKASNQGRLSVPFWRLWTRHQYISMGDGFGLSLWDEKKWRFFFFTPFIGWTILINFQMFNQFCISGINPPWLWGVILCLHCLLIFCCELLSLCSWEIIIYSFYHNFFVFFFNTRVILALWNEIGNIPFASILWKRLQRISTIFFFFLNIQWNH